VLKYPRPGFGGPTAAGGIVEKAGLAEAEEEKKTPPVTNDTDE